MWYGKPTEKEVHEGLDEFFAVATTNVWFDERLSRFHRSWVRKNSDKFYIVKKSEHMTGQPVYRYGNRIGPQYSAKGEHVGWGGSYWVHTWEIRRKEI
jgi:hypothetical protein